MLGNQTAYVNILRKFGEDFQAAAETLQNLAAAGSEPDAAILAHTIKGAAGNLGAEELGAAAAALEAWFKEGGRGLPEAPYQNFQTALARVMAALKNLPPAGEPAVKASPEAAAPLPAEVARAVVQRLREALDAGDVTELQAIAGELLARPDVGARYGEDIQRLAAEFDFDKIAELADKIGA